MFKIANNNIYISKGDDGDMTIRLKNGNTLRPFEDGDIITLTVKDSTNSVATRLVVQKTISGAEAGLEMTALSIPSSGTVNIPVGQYSCDVQIKTADGKYYTIFPSSIDAAKVKKDGNFRNFWVLPEVTPNV